MKENNKEAKPVLTEKQAVARALNYGWCRAVAHHWQPHGSIIVRNASFEMTVQCSHCFTVRTTTVDHAGRLVANRYRWPDNYRLDREHQKTKADMRRMILVEGRAFRVNTADQEKTSLTRTAAPLRVDAKTKIKGAA